jgi:cell wall-associated NlpC family hydrolase
MVAVVAYFFGPQVAGKVASGSSNSSTSDGAASNDGPALVKSARTHDDESYVYGGGHPPTGYKKGQGLDCSGLVDVAVMDVTGIKKNIVARGFQNDGNWSKIDFKDAREGDIVFLLKANHPGHSDDHVAFVVSNGGDGKMTVFEAATSRVRQPDQIRESSNRRYNEWDGALRFHR